MSAGELASLGTRYAAWGAAGAGAAARTADSLAALLTGAGTAEGAAILALDGWDDGVLAELARWVAVARLTELDDIHMPTCTTPGSVVVPAALAVAARLEATETAFARAVEIGYDAMTRLGAAIGGAHAVYRGVWPTYFCAPFAVAAAVASLLELDAAATANALGIALTRATGLTSGIAGAPLARWLTVGDAARAGAAAALAARASFVAEVDLERIAAGAGLSLETEWLTRDGALAAIDAVSVKPFPTAKQSLAATEAALAIARDVGGAAAEGEPIRVEVPSAFARMIANPPSAASRLSRVSSARWNVALALARADALDDVERALTPADDPALARLAQRVEVLADPVLDAGYPARWPARVAVGGASATVIDATGDPPANGIEAVRAKWTRLGRSLDGLDAAPGALAPALRAQLAR